MTKFMCRLVETIKIEDGKLCDVAYHIARAEKSKEILFGKGKPLNLEEALLRLQLPSSGVHKCRLLYRQTIEEIQIHPYIRRRVESLRLVVSNDIDYSLKYEDRSMFDALLSKKGICDDIIIIKNGYLTDTSFSNIALFDGIRWFTPARPLLFGTKRQKLVNEGVLIEDDISPKDLQRFMKLCLINTMLELGDVVVSIENIMGI